MHPALKRKASISHPRVYPLPPENALIGSTMWMLRSGALKVLPVLYQLLYNTSLHRGFVRAIGASSFGKADNSSSNSPPGITRHLSSEGKVRSLFRGIPSSSSSKETH